MGDTEARLQRCFLAVFTRMSPQAVPQATTETVQQWDSLATATLVAVVEEEFGILVAPEDLKQFTSFESIQDYLRNREDLT
jgi:acyl carrier protein